MPSIFELVPLIFEETFSSQSLPRTPETSSVMDEENSVLEYNQALSSKLALVYALSLEIIYRSREEGANERALDVACGPGHFSLQLAQHLEYQQVIGVDLSSRMIAAAKQNADAANLQNRVTFEPGDATRLSGFDDESFDLVTFCDAAHHMDSLESVSAVLAGMERVTKASGLIYVIDLVRLKSKWGTEKYVQMIGRDYQDRGLDSFFTDFHNSMYAAWTPSELASAIPKNTRRSWMQIVPIGLPTVQILIGLPQCRTACFVRRPSRSRMRRPQMLHGTLDWNLLRGSVYFSRLKLLTVPNKKEAATGTLQWPL
jgi:ubiquinone/menaquinone biosynthesis C-methylase UbiE